MAATARFSAEVRRINFRNTGDHLPAQEEILSSGGITILEDGDIPGANFSGYDLRRVGKIWTASAGEEKSLHEIILGIEPSEYEARVDAILRGYEKQEEAEQSRQDFNRGLRSWTT